ncbi:MAG: hypothetical protein QM778_36475 [Myxococcales bacterium]
MQLMLRRILLASLLGGVLPGLGLAHATSELEASLLERTRSLFELAPHWQRVPPRVLLVNGARLVLATGRSEQPLSAMLDHFQAHCRAESGGLHQAARAVYRSARKDLPSLIDGVLRVEEEKEGLVACLALGAKLSPRELLARLERFGEHADLQELGGLRVVRVRRVDEGSFFVATWNEGPLPLADMFPEQGDSPGDEPPDVPRPRQARRLLSAWQEGRPSGVYVYSVSAARDAVFESYVAELERGGWRLQDASSLVGGVPFHGAAFARGSQGLVVHTQADGEGTLISVLPLESRPRRHIIGKRF